MNGLALLARLGGEWASYPESMVILAVLTLAGIGTGVLFAVSVLAYWRRRSRRYGLVALAIGALFFRSVVGLGTVLGIVPMVLHHLLGHGLDFAVAALFLSTVVRTGSDSINPDFE